MSIKIRRGIIIKLLSPKGPNPESPQTPRFPSNKLNSTKLHPQLVFIIQLVGYIFKAPPRLLIPY